MQRFFHRFLNADRALAAFCLILAATFAVGTYYLPNPLAFQQISAKVWPAVLSIAMAVTAVLIWLDSDKPEAAVAEDPFVSAEEENPTGKAAWILLAGLVLSAPIMMYLGFWIAGTFLLGLVCALKETPGHLVRSAIFSIALPGAIYLLFTRVFSQFLPTGIFY